MALPVSKLHAVCSPESLPWPESAKIPGQRKGDGRSPFQPRAMHALDLALQINKPGYNVYLSGEADLGRTEMLLDYLRPIAARRPTPPDLVYARNFANPDNPRLLAFPAGQARKFAACMKELVENLRKGLEKKLDNGTFTDRKSDIIADFQKTRSAILDEMNQLASIENFSLDFDEENNLSLAPLKNGARIENRELAAIPADEKKEIARKAASLAKKMHPLMRRLGRNEENFQQADEWLQKLAMQETLDAVLAPFARKMRKNFAVEGLDDYFEALRKDVLENAASFSAESQQPGETRNQENFFDRYKINLFVDNGSGNGAPIIIEDNPASPNLLGCLERESEMGALVTDFSLVRAGSLQKANGGFLALHVEDLLQHPLAWEGLLRALGSGRVAIDDNMEMADAAIRTKGLAPEPVPLDLKVILIGTDDLYEELLDNDERFAKFFRIKAHMADQTERNARNIRHYLMHLAKMAREASLANFDATALAWLVDLGSHLCEDQKRLSLKFPLLKSIMIEADACARMAGRQLITSELLEKSWADRGYRSSLVEESFMEDYDRAMIRLDTTGSAIGQVNGLSITYSGDYEFGLPHRISCTVGVGHDGIIDLEREAELGGPIHTKAMMILKSYLTDQFARKKPLVLSASLYFEQSYAGIEGDSASGAELAALLSSLAEVPARLDLAFTGAVSHSGHILAVGGVTRKIEGFYKVCSRKGLTGTQGVIIPHANIDHLMLAPEILKSVEEGKFTIYPVRKIEEALELLTGLSAGRRRKNGGFTKGSLFDRVDQRLEDLGYAAQNAFRRQRGK